jgi:hypothetical protein
MARRYRNYLLTSNRNEYSVALVLFGEYGRTVPFQAKSQQSLAADSNLAFRK